MRVKENKLKDRFYDFDSWCSVVFNKFTNFLKSYWGYIIVAFVLLVIGILVRVAFYPQINGDTYWFLMSWVKFYRDNGLLAAIGKLPISQILDSGKYIPYWDVPDLSIYDPSQFIYCDYLVGYMSFVCLFSCLPVDLEVVTKILGTVTDIAMAVGVALIIHKIHKDKKISLMSFGITLFLPTAILNSGMWGQADGFYTCILVYSLYFIICDKPKLSVFFFGLSLGFKLQAIFALPLFGFLFLKKKIRLIHLLFIPLGIIATMIPFILGSGDFITPFRQYLGQIGNYPYPNYYSGSIYVLFDGNPAAFAPYINLFGIPLMIGVCILTLYLFFVKRVKATPRTIIAVAALYSFLVPFTLPHMHERYFYLADVFIIIYILTSKKKYHLGILQQFSSINCYSHFLFGYYLIPALDRGCMYFSLGINVYIIYQLFKDIYHSEQDPIESELISDFEYQENELNNSESLL